MAALKVFGACKKTSVWQTNVLLSVSACQVRINSKFCKKSILQIISSVEFSRNVRMSSVDETPQLNGSVISLLFQLNSDTVLKCNVKLYLWFFKWKISLTRRNQTKPTIKHCQMARTIGKLYHTNVIMVTSEHLYMAGCTLTQNIELVSLKCVVDSIWAFNSNWQVS